MIDTTGVTDRRILRFASPEELTRDVERLAAAEHLASLRRTGNWTLGQALGHLAAWVSYAYDGYPPQLRVPLLVRLGSTMMKRKFISGASRPGFRIPRIEGGTVGVEPLSTDEGLARFRHAWERLRKEPPAKPNPVFGRLTHAQWMDLHLRHAELHLGFFHPTD